MAAKENNAILMDELKYTSPKLYVVGLGPGGGEDMTVRAVRALEESQVIAGYSVYVDLVRRDFPDREFIVSGMGQEEERCRQCFELVKEGRTVALVCSGDPGVYGMASPVMMMAPEYPGCRVEIVSGVTAATGGASVLGAPVGHDFCVISLSDLLTPWELIERRLMAAAYGDFGIVIYNPRSKGRPEHLKKACEILLRTLPPGRVCGMVKKIGREGCESRICTLGELGTADADMYTTVFIGNSMTQVVDGRMVTPRIMMGSAGM